MRIETEHVDGNVYALIYSDKDELIAKFHVELISDEYHFQTQTPFTGNTIIHTANSYNHVEPWRGWKVK